MEHRDIRNPDIQYLTAIAQKYSHLLDANKEDFTEIIKHWQDLTVHTLETTQKAKINLFTKEQLPKYLEDNFRMYNVAVYSAWALGREYAETSPQQAKYYLLVEDINSDNLLESTKHELLDLADYAIQFLVHILLALYQSKIISESEFVMSVEKAKSMLNLGILWAFQNGIASLDKQQ